MNNIHIDDQEILILQKIHTSRENVRQRDLARIVGKSLGMTNAILKRLVKMGLLKITKINSRTVKYMVSPSGVKAITSRGYQYLKRTIRNVVDYKDILEKLVLDVVKAGYSVIVLVGKSDLDFIIEHLCHKNRLDLVRTETDKEMKEGFYVYSENYKGDCTRDAKNSISLNNLLLKKELNVRQL
ncbi:MAG: winged helix-turn-helix transcriptional regulator [Spirochaetales bacterium]|nr:winged helix-turn-helix transcriptional regulator [Spirochaetales bacterium]